MLRAKWSWTCALFPAASLGTIPAIKYNLSAEGDLGAAQSPGFRSICADSMSGGTLSWQILTNCDWAEGPLLSSKAPARHEIFIANCRSGGLWWRIILDIEFLVFANPLANDNVDAWFGHDDPHKNLGPGHNGSVKKVTPNRRKGGVALGDR